MQRSWSYRTRALQVISLLLIGLCLHGAVLGHTLCSAQVDTTLVTISGTVQDEFSGSPLKGVQVSIPALGVYTLSDSLGQFQLSELPRGTFELVLEKAGYERVSGPLQVRRSGSFAANLKPTGSALSQEPSRLSGRVREHRSTRPVEGVEVVLEGIEQGKVTDSEGRFLFPVVPPGRFLMSFHRLGYASRQDSIDVPPGRLITMEVGLSVEPVDLEPIEVLVESRSQPLELAGFYGRREAGSGLFLSQDEIEDRFPYTTSDIFEGLPGVRVVPGGLDRAVFLRGSGAAPCSPALWIDGLLVERGGGGGALINRFVSPAQIAGVEIYVSSLRIPLQFQGPGSRCGAIVIWTR